MSLRVLSWQEELAVPPQFSIPIENNHYHSSHLIFLNLKHFKLYKTVTPDDAHSSCMRGRGQVFCNLRFTGEGIETEELSSNH